MRTLLGWPILWYLRFWARAGLFLHKPYVIGIAGSVGKSSTRNALYAILKDYAATKVITGNSETGIPLGVVGITARDFSVSGWLSMLIKAPLGLMFLRNTKYLIVEMGIDDPYPPKNMSYLLSVVKPDCAISLNISPTHTEQFEKTLQEKQAQNVTTEKKLEYLLGRIAEEDTKIITQSDCKLGIYNADDKYINEKIADFLVLHRSKTLLSFGKAENNAIAYKDYSVNLKGTKFSFRVRNDMQPEEIDVFLEGYVLPKEYREVLAAAFLTAYKLGISLPQVKRAFEANFNLPKGRSSLFRGVRKTVIIDSSYNASPSAVTAFLDLTQDLKKQTDRPAAFLFGDMRELGEEAAQTHQEIARKIPEAVTTVYLVGPLTKEYVLPIVEKSKKITSVRWFPTALKAGEYLQDNLPKDTILLVKGSQNTIYLEEAIKKLLHNKQDEEKLCRQDRHWLVRKRAFFNIKRT